MNSEQKAFITSMQTTGVTQAEAFGFYDSLEPVSAKFMLGVWKGSECRTGHIMDGMLTIAPWYGKAFMSTEKVHPLVFEDKSGKKYCVDPRKVFRYIEEPAIMKLLTKFTQKVDTGKLSFDSHKLDPVFKAYKTVKSKARLREIRYRGAVTAAMIYDDLPIIDIFRKIDDTTVLGVMDLKGKMGEKGYFFLLQKCIKTPMV